MRASELLALRKVAAAAREMPRAIPTKTQLADPVACCIPAWAIVNLDKALAALDEVRRVKGRRGRRAT